MVRMGHMPPSSFVEGIGQHLEGGHLFLLGLGAGVPCRRI